MMGPILQEINSPQSEEEIERIRNEAFWWQPERWGEKGERLENFLNFYPIWIWFFIIYCLLPVFWAFGLITGVWWLSLILTGLFFMGLPKVRRWFLCSFLKYDWMQPDYIRNDETTWRSVQRYEAIIAIRDKLFLRKHFIALRKLISKKVTKARSYPHQRRETKKNEPIRKLKEKFKANYLQETPREQVTESREENLQPEDEWRIASNKWANDIAELIRRDWLGSLTNTLGHQSSWRFYIRTISGREIETYKPDITTGEYHIVSQNGFNVDENWVGGWQTSRKFPSMEVWAENKQMWNLGIELKICEELSNVKGPIHDDTSWLLIELRQTFELGLIDEQTYLQQVREILKEQL
tara:strand:- start:91 stop:1149 length:1059 start_codon:yes stop_codon:yes gene_type:complete